MSAALASLLEIQLEDVPNFYDAGHTDREWHHALKAWLTSLGYALIEVPLTEKGPGAFHWGGYAIASGPTVRQNGWHATVWHNGKIVHDPHPDGAGLLKIETLEFLYPLNPALPLTGPAQVGNTIFGVGIPARRVIERAQREHNYRQRPEPEAVRIAQSNRLLRGFWLEGALAELVELKGIKDALDEHAAGTRMIPGEELAELRKQYEMRKPRAWQRAREILQGFAEAG